MSLGHSKQQGCSMRPGHLKQQSRLMRPGRSKQQSRLMRPGRSKHSKRSYCQEGQKRCWKERFGGAVLVVVLVLAAPWCIAAVLQAQQNAGMHQEPSGAEIGQLSSNFLDMSPYSSVRFQREAGVCGFESQASPQQTLKDIQKELEEKQWVCVPSENETSASFYKAEGTYRWAYVSCGLVQNKTVVVCNVA